MRKVFQKLTFSAALSLILALFGGQVLAVPVASFEPAVNYAAGDHPCGIAVGDFNGDGRPDLVETNMMDDNVSVLINNGDGTFRPAVFYPVGLFPQSVAAEDADGDGRTDLIVGNLSSDDVSVLINNGDGTFTQAVNYPVGEAPRSLAAGDLNGDGRPDAATANQLSNDVSVLINRGDGSFEPAVHYPVGNVPQGVTTGDFNGDGRIDLAAANHDDNTVSILLNNGDGTFMTPVNYAVGGAPTGETVGDYNGDGKLDLAVSNVRTDNVSVLLNRGDGSFAPAVNYAVQDGPRSVTTADINGDGRIDLAAANLKSNSVSVLLNRGDGTFQAAVSFAGGSGTCCVVAGDFRGDGRPGLAVTNEFGFNVSVLLNTSVNLDITTTGLPAATIGTWYNVKLGVAGGTAPYSWSAAGLPPGLNINAYGRVVGYPIATGTWSFAITVRDSGGNTAGAEYVLPVKSVQALDGTAPATALSLSGQMGSNGWYVGDVQAVLAAADNPGGSGVGKTEYSFDGSSWADYTGPVNISGEGQTTVYYRSTDKAGNAETVKDTIVKIDKTAPQLTINAPVDGKEYVLNEKAAAGWLAADDLSGVDYESGTVLSGQLIDTGTVGEKTFTVTAADKAGNTIARTVTYHVVYSFSGVQAPIKEGKPIKAGSSIPVKFQLKDAAGNYISTAAAELNLTKVSNSPGAASQAAGAAVPAVLFRYDSAADQYIVNLHTKNMAAGTWRLKIDLDDGTAKFLDIILEAPKK